MAKKIKDLKDLKFDDKNINKGSEYGGALLTKSLQEVGAGRSVLADKNGVLIAGNKTVEKFGEAGLTKIKVVETTGDELVVVQRTDLDINSPQGAKMKILDNTVSKHNYIEDAEVAEAICEEFDLEPVELGLQDKPTELEAQEDDFDVPEGGIETDIVLGDLFEIGEHRLLCGDSTDSDQVAKLMNGQKADISFTSPPYNAGTTPTEIKMGKTSKYANDDDNKDESEYLNLLTEFTNNTLLFSEYSFVNIQSLSGNKTALIDFLYNMKTVYADTIIWQKQNAQPAMAENVLNSQFEYIHIFSHKANRAIGVKKFRGTLSNVLEISKQTKNEVKEHNATFPIDLANYFVSNFSEKSVIDLFLGSGTTMVAAHQLNRKCYGMELDPKYCQVIVDRMRKLDPNIEIKRNGKPYIPNNA